MEAQRRLCGFSATLERLLAARDAAAFEAEWIAQDVQRVGWEALALARQANTEALEPVLAEVDRRLLAVLERCRAFVDSHVVTFRVPELERWQHAAAAALVGARWGVAGLRTVIADTGAPLGRRYFAFLALAERHPPGAWGLFLKYLRRPDAHHAFDNPVFKEGPQLASQSQTTRRCTMKEEPAGTIINAVTKQPFTMEDACVERGPHVGYNAAATAAATQAVKEFFRTTLKPN